jgi:two-component system alkaline phosphatase synthesis response regulator PhoP
MRGKKILLVVEDTENIRKIIKFTLAQRDYEVLESGNGLEAMRLAKTRLPDLILLDVMLPDKTGFDICSELKADPRYAGIKIVMLTAITKDTGKNDAYWKERCGADGFLSKPFRARDVLETIEKLLVSSAGESEPPASGEQPA